jgi:hypothetical protein
MDAPGLWNTQQPGHLRFQGPVLLHDPATLRDGEKRYPNFGPPIVEYQEP